MKGSRKFILGLVYLVGMFVLAGIAVATDKTAVLVGAVASMAVTLATGLGVIVWGNSQEHKAAAAAKKDDSNDVSK